MARSDLRMKKSHRGDRAARPTLKEGGGEDAKYEGEASQEGQGQEGEGPGDLLPPGALPPGRSGRGGLQPVLHLLAPAPQERGHIHLGDGLPSSG